MVAAGEATTDGSGRYRLAGHLAARQSAPVRQPCRERPAPTTGAWWLAVVTTTGSTAEVRGARRRALAYARLAELREGVWMRPANVAVALPDSLETDVELMTARPGGSAGAGRTGCGTSGRGRTGRATLLRGLDALAPDGPEALAPGFELSAAVLRHLQADPLLPAELLPADWPGASCARPTTSGTPATAPRCDEWSRAG